jgi:hypothetical protein
MRTTALRTAVRAVTPRGDTVPPVKSGLPPNAAPRVSVVPECDVPHRDAPLAASMLRR